MLGRGPHNIPVRPLIYLATVIPFTVVYAGTAAPFTAAYISSFAQPPNVGAVLLFGVWHLEQVYEFCLPLLVLALEAVSLQLSAAVWSLWIDRRVVTLVPALLVFLFAQAFPTFSLYWDARSTAFSEVKNTDLVPVSPVKLAEVRAENESKMRQYDLAKQAFDESQKAIDEQLSQQVVDIEGQLAPVDAALGQLQQRIPRGWTVADWQRFNSLNDTRANLATRLADAQQARQERIAHPLQPPEIPQLVQEPQAEPRYKSLVQFLTETAGTPESLLTIFAALIFPAIVLAAGFVIARYSHGDALSASPGRASIAGIGIDAELRLGETLRPELQPQFADSLGAVIAARVAAARSQAANQAATTTMFLETSQELKLLKAAEAITEAVNRGGLTEKAKAKILDHIEKAINPTTGTHSQRL